MRPQSFLAGATALLLAAIALAQPVGASPPRQTPILSGAPYRAPVFITPYQAVFGDSRSGFAGGVGYNGTSFNSNENFNQNYVSFMPLVNPAVLFSTSYNYGIPSQSTAGFLGRLKSTLNYCADSAASTPTTAVCWPAGASRSNLNATSSAGVNYLCFAAAPSVSIGYIVMYAAGVPANTTVTGTTGTPCANAGVTLSNTLTATIASGASITFAPFNTVNPYWLYTGGANDTSLADSDYSWTSTGQYSACTDPAPIVLYLGGTNDGGNGFTIMQSLINEAQIVDSFGPRGCNKILIAADETPRGMATAMAEYHTVPAGGGTVTVNHSGAGTFFADLNALYYAPSGVQGAPNTLGANDGMKLVNCTPCTPGTGQYNVSSTGVYTFAAGDANAKFVVYYQWYQYPYGNSLLAIHDWFLATSCGSFYSPLTATTYPISGAQCNRPWLHIAKTWEATVDPNNGQYPLPYVFPDGLHMGTRGGILMANAFNVELSKIIGTASKVSSPAVNNPFFSGSASSSVSAQPNACTGITGTTRNYFLTGLSPSATANPTLYKTGSKIYAGSAGIIPVGVAIDCVDTANNQLHMVSPSAGSATLTNNLAQADPGDWTANPLFDHVMTTTTLPGGCNTNSRCGTPSFNAGTGSFGGGCASGCTTFSQAYPAGWVYQMGGPDQTSVQSGATVHNYGVETNTGTGQDDFGLSVGGLAGTNYTSFQLSYTANGVVDAAQAAGTKYRATCVISVDKGANGHLWGLDGVQIQLAGVTATGSTFIAPGTSSNTYTQWAVYQGVSTSGFQFSDVDVQNGPWTYTYTSNLLDTTLFTTPFSKLFLGVTFLADPNVPVSFSARVSQCAIKQVTQ